MVNISDYKDIDGNPIVLGGEYFIVGTKGGCTSTRCKTCQSFKGSSIIVNKLMLDELKVSANRTGSSIHCGFVPEDLRRVKVSWKERLERLKQ